jgi:hypothetical protein
MCKQLITAGNDTIKEKAMSKEILAAQREIIQGYYARIFHQKPDLETMLQWFEDDLEYLAQEDAVEGAKDIIMNYDPHEVGEVECNLLKHTWVAVRPKGVDELECPNCSGMTEIQ